MSDEIYLDEYEDWEPHSAADELVERTIPSPVLTSYTAALEWLSDWDSEDFEDSEDEYDNLSALSSRRSGQDDHHGAKNKDAKSSQRSSDVQNKRINLRQPVLWKPWRERLPSPEVPIWKDDQHPKIALLKDWRQRLQNIKEPVKASKISKGGGRQGRRGVKVKPVLASEISLDGDLEEENEIDEITSELPPTALHEAQSTEPSKKSSGHGYTNGTASSLARQAVLRASNEEGTVGAQGQKRKASEPPETNGSVSHEFKPKRGRPAKKVKESEKEVDDAERSNSKVATEETGKAVKKGTRGRPKGSTQASKVSSTAVTVASTRTTRNNKKR